jgi:hypothetical protein
MLRIMPVVISYFSYPWIKVSLLSFREHFPLSPILIIDNNPDVGSPQEMRKVQEERSWIHKWREKDVCNEWIKSEIPQKRHGLAMDLAAMWCRSNRIPWLLHIEPDCLISGVNWARQILEPIKQGAWMCGSCLKEYGPIHPTPSIWSVNYLASSFEVQLRGDDVWHPKFHTLFDMKKLSELVGGLGDYWGHYWDTAQRAWFDAAKEDKAVSVDPSPDFKHFWRGSSSDTDPFRCGDDRVFKYL